MRILNVSGAGCGRMIKEGLSVQELGHEVVNLSNNWSDNVYFPFMDIMSYWSGFEQLSDKLKKFQSVDIVHVHSEPKFLGRIVRDALPNVCMVYDVHDSELFVKGEHIQAEISSYDAADAFVFPCKTYAEKLANNKPFEVIYNKAHPLVSLLKPMPRVGGVVYEGSLNVEYLKHRDYRGLAEWFTDNNIPFHIYTSNVKHLDKYGDTGAILNAPKHQFELMQTLTRFDWGLAASPNDVEIHPQWQAAVPHKMFDYAASGLPVLTWGNTEMAEIVRETYCGIVLDHKEDLLNCYKEHEAIRASLENRREEFTMKTEGVKLEAFYKKVLNG